jgi:hypothetical protein
MLGIELAGGALIFLAFTIFYTLAVAYGLYSRSGSAISQRPYAKVYASAPGARATYREHDVSAWSRGTR